MIKRYTIQIILPNMRTYIIIFIRHTFIMEYKFTVRQVNLIMYQYLALGIGKRQTHTTANTIQRIFYLLHIFAMQYKYVADLHITHCVLQMIRLSLK